MRAQIIHTAVIITLAAVAAPAAAQDPIDDLRAFALQQARPLPRPGARGSQPRGPETSDEFTRTIRIGNNGVLDLENLAGDVVITGGGGNDVVIRATKRAFGSTEEQRRARLQEVGISVLERGNRIEVETEYPRMDRPGIRGRNVNVIVDYTITVPQNTAVTIESVSGDVRASNLRGMVSLESVSGDVEVQNIRDGSVDLSTVSGNIVFTDVEVPVAEGETVSGSVRFSGELQRNGRYELSSHSGDITMQVAEEAGFTVEANTFSGDIRSDFPVTLGGNSRDGSRRRGPGSAIRGTFGDGSAVLELRSFSGSITLNRR